MDEPISTEGNALATNLICEALLRTLIAAELLTPDDVSGLLRSARSALGSGPVRAAGETDAARLIDSLISRYAP